MALHPVDVAFQRVDLAVMRQHAERLGQRPLREGVGGIALVIDRKGGLKPFVHQVGIELRHLFGQHHALVDDRPAGHRTDIHAHDARSGRSFFDPATDDVKLALELFLIHILFAADQDLLDLWAGGIGLFAQHVGVHRYMAPAIDIVAQPQDFGFHDRAATFLCAKIGARQEHLTDSDQLVCVRLMTCATDLIIKERHGNLHMDASAIAGFAIRIDSATVPNGLQRVDTLFHDAA